MKKINQIRVKLQYFFTCPGYMIVTNFFTRKFAQLHLNYFINCMYLRFTLVYVKIKKLFVGLWDFVKRTYHFYVFLQLFFTVCNSSQTENNHQGAVTIHHFYWMWYQRFTRFCHQTKACVAATAIKLEVLYRCHQLNKNGINLG